MRMMRSVIISHTVYQAFKTIYLSLCTAALFLGDTVSCHTGLTSPSWLGDVWTKKIRYCLQQHAPPRHAQLLHSRNCHASTTPPLCSPRPWGAEDNPHARHYAIGMPVLAGFVAICSRLLFPVHSSFVALAIQYPSTSFMLICSRVGSVTFWEGGGREGGGGRR